MDVRFDVAVFKTGEEYYAENAIGCSLAFSIIKDW